MFPKNHPTILMVVPSYFKLNPDKEENITDMLSHAYPSDQIGSIQLFPQTVELFFEKVF